MIPSDVKKRKKRNQMKTMLTFRVLCVSAALGFAVGAKAQPQLITNGGFESGLSGWTRVDQIGSDGTFFVQSGAASPVNGFPVPAPPEGVQAVMTDASAGGSHLLYQDFTVPISLLSGTIGFSLFLNSGDAFHNPASLDWAATNNPGTLNLNQLNQQVRADIVRTSADPFSVAAGDVLQNLFQTRPTDALVAGYNTVSTDISALLGANQGQTLRLRFAEVDNVSFLNLGVDQVSIEATVPEPSPMALMMAGGLLGVGAALRRRKSTG
jgi:hypothetical protein